MAAAAQSTHEAPLATIAVTPGGERVPLPPRVVFFDGVCGFCDQSVRWLLARDARERLHYAPLQGETAAALRQRDPERFPEGLDTMVYAERRGDDVVYSLRSDAALAILAEIDGQQTAVRWLRRLPRWLADLGYRLFARIRYRVFGRLDACRVPSERVRARFLA